MDKFFPHESPSCLHDVKFLYACLGARFGELQRFSGQQLLASCSPQLSFFWCMLLYLVPVIEPSRVDIPYPSLVDLIPPLQRSAIAIAAWLLYSLSGLDTVQPLSSSIDPPPSSEPGTTLHRNTTCLVTIFISLSILMAAQAPQPKKSARMIRSWRTRKKRSNIPCWSSSLSSPPNRRLAPSCKVPFAHRYFFELPLHIRRSNPQLRPRTVTLFHLDLLIMNLLFLMIFSPPEPTPRIIWKCISSYCYSPFSPCPHLLGLTFFPLTSIVLLLLVSWLPNMSDKRNRQPPNRSGPPSRNRKSSNPNNQQGQGRNRPPPPRGNSTSQQFRTATFNAQQLAAEKEAEALAWGYNALTIEAPGSASSSSPATQTTKHSTIEMNQSVSSLLHQLHGDAQPKAEAVLFLNLSPEREHQQMNTQKKLRVVYDDGTHLDTTCWADLTITSVSQILTKITSRNCYSLGDIGSTEDRFAIVFNLSTPQTVGSSFANDAIPSYLHVHQKILAGTVTTKEDKEGLRFSTFDMVPLYLRRDATMTNAAVMNATRTSVTWQVIAHLVIVSPGLGTALHTIMSLLRVLLASALHIPATDAYALFMLLPVTVTFTGNDQTKLNPSAYPYSISIIMKRDPADSENQEAYNQVIATLFTNQFDPVTIANLCGFRGVFTKPISNQPASTVRAQDIPPQVRTHSLAILRFVNLPVWLTPGRLYLMLTCGYQTDILFVWEHMRQYNAEHTHQPARLATDTLASFRNPADMKRFMKSLDTFYEFIHNLNLPDSSPTNNPPVPDASVSVHIEHGSAGPSSTTEALPPPVMSRTTLEELLKVHHLRPFPPTPPPPPSAKRSRADLDPNTEDIDDYDDDMDITPENTSILSTTDLPASISAMDAAIQYIHKDTSGQTLKNFLIRLHASPSTHTTSNINLIFSFANSMNPDFQMVDTREWTKSGLVVQEHAKADPSSAPTST